MRRRIAALLLCVLLAVQLALPPAQAAERVYFTAVGNRVLPLSDATMPVWTGGYLYIPNSVFSGAGREILGVSQVLNTEQGRLVLYSGGRSLTFDLGQTFARDNDGQLYYPGAIRRNGLVFIPVYAVTRCFDLTYSIIEVERGSLVWIRGAGYNLSESLYADAAQYPMESIYTDYLRSKEQSDAVPSSPSTSGGSSSGGASGGANSPAVSPPATAAQGTELHGKRVYLCLEGGSAALLDTLDSYGAQAAFFFTPEEMAASDDLLRRMSAQGQAIGILADAADPERPVQEQLEAGNRALFQAACGMTRLAIVRNGGGQEGFRCIQPDMDRSAQPLRTSSGAESLLQRISKSRGSVTVWLGAETTAAGLRSLLSAIREAGGVCARVTETS